MSYKPEILHKTQSKEDGMKTRSGLGMLFVLLTGVGAALAGSTGPDDRAITDPKSVVSAPNSAARAVPVDDLYYTRSVFGAAWSPDGQQVLFSSDISGRFNLWKVKAMGGWPVQLTQSDDVQSGAAWSPDGKWIVYQQDHAGNELYDLYAIPSDGGEPINLTNTPETREQEARWSPDGKTIAFVEKAKDGAEFEVGLLDWATRKVRKLTNEKKPGYWLSLVAWSKDSKALYAVRINPPSRIPILSASMCPQEPSRISRPIRARCVIWPPRFLPTEARCCSARTQLAAI